MLELGSLSTQQPEVALMLADRVVEENLTLDVIRILVRGYARPEVRDASRIGSAERRGAATKVQEITKSAVTEHNKNDNSQSSATDFQDTPGRRDLPEPPQGQSDPPMVTVGELILPARSPIPTVTDEELLQQATETLTILASHAERLRINELTGQLLDRLETVLAILRRAFGDRTSV
jgi:hypothetical protein